jgi:hypothetical protein
MRFVSIFINWLKSLFSKKQVNIPTVNTPTVNIPAVITPRKSPELSKEQRKARKVRKFQRLNKNKRRRAYYQKTHIHAA